MVCADSSSLTLGIKKYTLTLEEPDALTNTLLLSGLKQSTYMCIHMRACAYLKEKKERECKVTRQHQECLIKFWNRLWVLVL